MPTRTVFSMICLVSAAMIFLFFGNGSAQTRLAPKQISGSGQVTVMVCAPNMPTVDCAGLVFVDLIRPDGSHLTAIGGPAPAGFVPDARWVTVVPAPATAQ